MNRIHRKVEYALIALKHMNQKRPGQLTTVKEICSHYGCPFDATSRVLQMMVQKKLLKSEQGAQGGYFILKDLAKVTLYDLISITVGPIGVVKCLDNGNSHCDIFNRCSVVGPLSYLNDQLVDFYKGISISSLLEAPEKKIAPIVFSSPEEVSL